MFRNSWVHAGHRVRGAGCGISGVGAGGGVGGLVFQSLIRQGLCTIMHPNWFHSGDAMPANLTLKNIPDEVYNRLKDVAEAHHRSMNGEAIACLESALLPSQVSVAERLLRARALRATIKPKGFKVSEIAGAIKQGRP